MAGRKERRSERTRLLPACDERWTLFDLIRKREREKDRVTSLFQRIPFRIDYYYHYYYFLVVGIEGLFDL